MFFTEVFVQRRFDLCSKCLLAVELVEQEVEDAKENVLLSMK